jgi:agmatine/peptidylarginine deiminase
MYNWNDENNLKVLEIFKSALPNHKIIGVDASVIIRQGGSWHCSTMNKFKLLS